MDKVLEIGTGFGYQAAVFAEIVDIVYTIEIIEELAVRATLNLKALGCENIHVKHADGTSAGRNPRVDIVQLCPATAF